MPAFAQSDRYDGLANIPMAEKPVRHCFCYPFG
jgi:hypothetical protein